MSKAQINYLLVLATIFVGWCFFHTFYIGAKMSPKPAVFGGGKFPVFDRANAPVVAPNMAEAAKIFAEAAKKASMQKSGETQLPLVPAPAKEEKKK